MEEINISSFVKNFNPDINSTQQSTSNKLWYGYIQGFLFNVLQKYLGHEYVQRIFMFQDLLTRYPGIRTICDTWIGNPNENKSFISLHFTTTSSCGLINMDTLYPTLMSWKILVHKSFLINITIIKAYIPFSDWCSLHHITIYEGHRSDKQLLIEQFCGHTYMENIYTKHDKGTLLMYFNTTVIYEAVVMNAMYQVQDKAPVAYRYYIDRSASLSLDPSSVVIENQVLRYFWYVSNSLYVAPHGKGHLIVKTYTSYIVMRLSLYNCSVNESHISVYSGLQAYYLVRWRARHHADVQCNITKETDTYLHSIYSTLLLTQSVFVQGSIRMSLYMSVKMLSSKTLVPGSRQRISYRDFNTYHTFQYVIGGSQRRRKKGDRKFWYIVHLHKLTVTHFMQPSAKPSVKQATIITPSTLNLSRSHPNIKEIPYTEGKPFYI